MGVIDRLSHRRAVVVGWGCPSEISWLLLDGLSIGGILWGVGLSIGRVLRIVWLCVGSLVGHLHDDSGSIIRVIRVLTHDFLSELILLPLSVAIAGEGNDKGHADNTSDYCSSDHTRLRLIVVIVAVTIRRHAVAPVVATVVDAVLVVTLRVIPH